jgi:hypothetical protein
MSTLLAAAEKLKSKSYESDATNEGFWSPTVDKSGAGYAVIRFLPACEGEDVAWVRYWDHGFKGANGRWYIENSLTSIGQEDPVSELNSRLWNASDKDDSPERKQARDQKRRLHYISNILVISDPANPENEGKVFLFKYGKKIFDKVDDLMHPNPEFEDEKPVNPFDFWGGANFKLKIRKVEGYRNYDKSEFEAPTPLFNGDDKKLEAIYKELKPLQPFLDKKNFKSYADLKKKLIEVLGADVVNGTSAPEASAEQPEVRSTPPTSPGDEAAESKDESEASDGALPSEPAGGKGMSYFARLANS